MRGVVATASVRPSEQRRTWSPGRAPGVGRVDRDAGSSADGAGEDAALGVDGGLLGGEAAAADQLGRSTGVVGGELLQRPVAQEVGAAGADVGELEVAVAGKGGRGHGGAHAPQAGSPAARSRMAAVRLPDGGGQRLGGLGGRRARGRRGPPAGATAAAEATSPPWWPPSPSATANTVRPQK